MNYTAREAAVKILYRVFEKGGYSNIALNDFLRQFKGDPRDRSLITELVYGTITRKNTLDWLILKFSRLPLKKIDPFTLNTLRTAVYQLTFLEKIPAPVVVNEAVNATRRLSGPGAAKFVNGVLRSFVRERSNVVYPSQSTEPIKYISLKHSHPEWLIEYWLKHFSYEFVEGLCEANNLRPPLTVRINTLKTGIDEVKASLKTDGFTTVPCRFVPEGLAISGPRSITETKAYINGWMQPQDEGSMLVSHMLLPEPGQLVIDVCAGPGGKTTHIAQLMQNRGKIISSDIFRHKINLIKGLVNRLGITIVQTELSDGTKVEQSLKGIADRVLVDAPCMGFGIIRRKPDIKWVKKPEDIAEIVGIQKQLLEASAALVKPGGLLVYSTCSIGAEENEGVVDGFLKNHPDFDASDISAEARDMFGIDLEGPFMRLYPNVHGTDGFFAARLIKRI